MGRAPARGQLGGHLCTGLEDTFYLPDGTKADSNGPLIEQLAEYARNAGREVASPQEARGMLGLREAGMPQEVVALSGRFPDFPLCEGDAV